VQSAASVQKTGLLAEPNRTIRQTRQEHREGRRRQERLPSLHNLPARRRENRGHCLLRNLHAQIQL
jgi:hypothetical protein